MCITKFQLSIVILPNGFHLHPSYRIMYLESLEMQVCILSPTHLSEKCIAVCRYVMYMEPTPTYQNSGVVGGATPIYNLGSCLLTNR